MHRSTKTYGHDVGLSACFRQWRAESHCSYLHGYALAISFTFEAQELDADNWVVDFGGLKSLKAILQDKFDHKLIVAHDDPELGRFMELHHAAVADVVVIPAVGCEKFAEHVFGIAKAWLQDKHLAPRVRLVSVEVREHGANSGIYCEEA